MRIEFISEEKLMTIKSNTNSIYNNYTSSGTLELENLIGGESPFSASNFEIEDFDLDMSNLDSKLTDLENIKRIYKHFKFLSKSQASDERLWAALCCGRYFKYMEYRWPIESEKRFSNRYLFNYGIHRSLFRNGLARLWWLGNLTYDSKRTNPYELTEFIYEDTDYIISLFDRVFSNNKIIVQAAISGLIDSKKSGQKVNRVIVREIGKYINILGGTYIIDCLSYEEIYKKVKSKVVELQGRK